MIRTEIVEFCRSHGIVLEVHPSSSEHGVYDPDSYIGVGCACAGDAIRSPLDRWPCKEVREKSSPHFPPVFITEGMTPVGMFYPHAILRAQGFVPLVKSADHTRIISNADVFDFELDSTEITELDQLDECTSSSSVVPAFSPFIVNTINERLSDRLGSN